MTVEANQPGSVGVVDLGAQCALLLVAQRGASGGLEVIEDHALHPCLGEDLVPGGRLKPQAVERTLVVLETFAGRLALRGLAPERVQAVATSPLRAASDGPEFLARVREQTGLVLQVLDPREEARLAWLGASGGAAPAHVLDVGGGSSEWVGPGPGEACSVPLGALNLAPRLGPALGLGHGERPGPPCSLPEARAAVDALIAELSPRPEGGAALHPSGPWYLTGGSALNAASIHLGLESYEPRLAHGVELSGARLGELTEALWGAPLDQLLDLPIEPARARVLPYGLLLLSRLLPWLGVSAARVSGLGLRHGAARSLLGAPGTSPGPVRIQGGPG